MTRRIADLNKGSELVKNITFLTIGQFGTKLLSFLLVPLYTNILTTSEYGTYDLVHSTVSVMLPLLTLNIQEAVMRYSMEKMESKSDIFTFGMKITLLGNAIILLFILINSYYSFSFIIKENSLFFFLFFFVSGVGSLLLGFSRGLERVKDISISGVLCSFAIIVCNILFLCIFKWGLKGYFIANIIGPFVQIVYLSKRIDIKSYINGKRDQELSLKLLKFSLPTIANSVAWWVNNLADRYLVTWLCGLAANGIYSVASKIPSIINVFQSIFNQAWSISAVKEFDPEDKDDYFSSIYNVYNGVLVVLCSLIIMCDKIFARFLYANDFYEAWKYVPFLTISIIFGAISGYTGSIFLALKKSDLFVKCSGSGAIINILLNVLLIPYTGTLGAAVATLVSYWTVYIVGIFYMKKYIKISLNVAKDNSAYLVLVGQSILLLCIDNLIIMYVLQIICLAVLVIMYYLEISRFLKKIVRKVLRK